MTILTFPWDDIGPANELTVVDISRTYKTDYEGGYQATRPKTTKMPKRFTVTWNFLKNDQWLAFVEFWRSVFGSANAFYWEFPMELYDVGAWDGDDMGTEDPGGWDSEGDGMGFGAGPVFLVRFGEDTLQQKYREPGYWTVAAVFDEIA